MALSIASPAAWAKHIKTENKSINFRSGQQGKTAFFIVSRDFQFAIKDKKAKIGQEKWTSPLPYLKMIGIY